MQCSVTVAVCAGITSQTRLSGGLQNGLKKVEASLMGLGSAYAAVLIFRLLAALSTYAVLRRP